MALTLADFATPTTDGTTVPLVPIAPDAILTVSDTLTLAACKRGSGEPVLARLKKGTDGAPDSWRATPRLSDIARAIAGGLLA